MDSLVLIFNKFNNKSIPQIVKYFFTLNRLINFENLENSPIVLKVINYSIFVNQSQIT